MKKFKGTFEQLKEFIQSRGFEGDWSHDDPAKYVFRSRNGAILNWWGATSTIQFQGDSDDRARLEAIFADGVPAAEWVGSVRAPIQEKHQIFIVHGHDTEARDQLELALHRLDLEPFILMNTSGGGQTIIEALEGQIGRDFRSDFGIVLMTPDDMGYLQVDGADRAEPRPRQNVVLETGMLLSSLTRLRMAILVKGHVELPSDLSGVIQLRYNNHVREIIPKLCQRLQESGFELDTNKIASAAQ
jgi:predicted nucleotide-binding protein